MKLKIAATLILAIFICGPVSSQEKNKKKVILTGKIVNRDSIPISNVVIFIDGKNSNIVTNAKGEFRLKFKPDVQKISFYSPQDGIFEIDYNGQERLEIYMKHDANALINAPLIDERVVNIGYGTVSENDLVGSVSTVKKDESNKRVYRDIYEMILGEVPGVTVEGGSLRIRGNGSLNGSNDPLLVVDGSPTTSILSISPDDVASINILKGSSAAIYGTRGANGVILIKTKRGGKK
jgi:TonB-dependent starch-binding outer membrane protein SusC